MVGIHLSDLPPSPLTDHTIPTDSLHHVTVIVDDSCEPAGVDLSTLPDSGLRLYEPYPNPCELETHLRFSLPAAEDVEIAIYDTTGRCVISLIEGFASAGTHELVWDGASADGAHVPRGVYYARMRAGEASQQVKILYLAHP